MSERNGKTKFEKGAGVVKTMLTHPEEALTLFGKDRYKALKIRLFFLIGALAGAPLLILVILGFFWLRATIDENFNNYLRWQMENTKQSIEIFLREKTSGLKFLVSAYTYDQLSNQKTLQEIFAKRKREFSDLVDLGVIDSKGIQRAYAGPYDLLGKDYSSHDWYQKVLVRGVYVSDVFLGYRQIPHFVIAVKQDLSDPRGFWIIRATIDIETLTRLVSSASLREGDDAFIINDDGILQTPSRSYGRLLERIKLDMIPERRGFNLVKRPVGSAQATSGYVAINDSPWILIAEFKSTSYAAMMDLLRRHIAALYLVLGLIVIGIVMNYRTTRMVVNWIQKADREREEAISQTEHSAKLASIGRLAAGVAHEINNPLAIINEKAGLMKDILELSEEAASCRDKFEPLILAISASVERCRTITHRLLGFARRMEVKIEGIGINDAVQEVIGFLEREILYRDIHLQLNLAEGLPRIESDRGQLQQVFLNIINNAIDAVGEGGIITVTTRAIILPDGRNQVRVIIRDNGQGIPKEVLKHIFEPFYTTKEKGKGTGLGLSLSYGIIQRLGGTIEVESVAGKGTAFTIALPVHIEEGEKPA